MSRHTDPRPRSYDEARAYLGTKTDRPIGNNTRLQFHGERICVRLHYTNIVTFYRDGRVSLSTGGWNTVTTRERMNRYLPEGWRVWTDRGDLYLYHRTSIDADGYPQYARHAWTDGVVVDTRTDATDAPLKPKRTHRPHTNPACLCAACQARRDGDARATRWRNEYGQARTSETTTPEDTATEATIPEGVDGMRWSEYNRKFNEMLRGA